MNILIYAIAMIVSFLGLLVGIILSDIAIEEINRVSIYLKYLNIILVPIIIGVATYDINKLYSIIFSGITLGILFILRNKYNDAWAYSCIGALLYVSTLSNTTLEISILIFIYGISIATINASSHFDKKINEQNTISENISLAKKILIKYSYYLLVGVVFYFTFSYLL